MSFGMLELSSSFAMWCVYVYGFSGLLFFFLNDKVIKLPRF